MTAARNPSRKSSKLCAHVQHICPHVQHIDLRYDNLKQTAKIKKAHNPLLSTLVSFFLANIKIIQIIISR